MTRSPTAAYNQFDVLLVPFPFVDSAQSKKRPAVVVSAAPHFNVQAGASILAMITSATHHPWPLDYLIQDLPTAGLPAASLIRMKLFTLDHRLIINTIGKLSKTDQQAFSKLLSKLFMI